MPAHFVGGPLSMANLKNKNFVCDWIYLIIWSKVLFGFDLNLFDNWIEFDRFVVSKSLQLLPDPATDERLKIATWTSPFPSPPAVPGIRSSSVGQTPLIKLL